jgi:hypothetical protein
MLNDKIQNFPVNTGSRDITLLRSLGDVAGLLQISRTFVTVVEKLGIREI